MTEFEIKAIEERVKKNGEVVKDILADANALVCALRNRPDLKDELDRAYARIEELEKTNQTLQSQVDAIRGLL